MIKKSWNKYKQKCCRNITLWYRWRMLVMGDKGLFFNETFLVKIQLHYQCIHLRNWSVFYLVKFIIYKQIEKSWKCIGKKGWESRLSSGVICWVKIKTILALSGPRSKPVRWCSLESCHQINDYNVRWFWKNVHIFVTQT